MDRQGYDADDPVAPIPVPWWRSWRTTLVGAFLVLAVVVGVAELVRAVNAYRYAERAALDKSGEVASSLARTTEQFVARYGAIAETAAQAIFEPPLSAAERRRLLATIKRAHPEIVDITAVGADGRLVDAEPPGLTARDLTDRGYYRQIAGGRSLFVSDLFVGKVTGSFDVAVVGAARRADGTPDGMVVVRPRADSLGTELALWLSGGAYPLVVDRTGRVIVHGAAPELTWQQRDYSRVPLVVDALRTELPRSGRFESPVNGQATLGAVVPMPRIGWAVAVAQPLEAVLASARRQRDVAVLTTGVVLGLGFAFAFGLGTRLSRPILALDGGVNAITGGDLGHRVALRDRGELGRLARHFNAMAARLEAVRAQEQELALQAQAAQRRTSFLAEASTRIAASLDYEATLKAIARLAVPALADCCLIDLVDADRPFRRVALAHADPMREPLLSGLDRQQLDLDGPHPAAVALRTGQSQLVAEVTDAWLVTVRQAGGDLDVLAELAPRSYMCVPLVARRRTLGVISLVSSRSGRQYGEGELTLAEDLAQRAALAVDNARLFRAAQEAIREAQAAIRGREDFLARASHELRTPLTSALGTLQLLKRSVGGALREAPEHLVGIAIRNLQNMTDLVNDLLDASKLAAGREALTLVPVELAGLVGAALEVVAVPAREKGIHLRVAVPPGLVVRADRLKLEQVLVNLAANAIKFTPAGGEVALEAEALANRLLLRMRDTGEGIPREYLERIFEPFFQASSGNGRRPRGTGLGLAICRQIVQLHGGRIWAESEGIGCGSTFVVSVPIEEAGDRAA